MRRWHRWIMTAFAVTLAYWVVSGILMALYDATDPTQVWAIEGGGPDARLNDAARTALPVPEPQTLAAGIGRALQRMRALPVASVDLRMAGSVPRLELADIRGNRDTMGRFYAETGEPMTQLVADGDPDANVPDYVNSRNYLKSWHRGNIAGLFGQFVGLFTGLALIALVITGVVLYFQIWNARRRGGRRAFFWSARESLWRRLHRWVSIVAAAFVLNIALSGTVLAWGEIQLRFFLSYHVGFGPYPRPSPLPAVSSGVVTGDAVAMLHRAYDAARASNPAGRITAIELIVRDGVEKSLVTLGGESPRTLAFNAVSGVPAADWRTGGLQVGNGYFADWHQTLKRIHRGDIIGHFSGRYYDLAAGFALLYLVVSGIVMYFQLLQQRQRSSREGWFWR